MSNRNAPATDIEKAEVRGYVAALSRLDQGLEAMVAALDARSVAHGRVGDVRASIASESAARAHQATRNTIELLLAEVERG